MIRKANDKDLARIAEIQIFNYRLYFYPIFQADEYYFEELQVPSLMKEYESQLDSLYVFDDGAVKGFIKIEGTYIARLFVEPVLQNACIGSKLRGERAQCGPSLGIGKECKGDTVLRTAWVCCNRREKTGRWNCGIPDTFKEVRWNSVL